MNFNNVGHNGSKQNITDICEGKHFNRFYYIIDK